MDEVLTEEEVEISEDEENIDPENIDAQMSEMRDETLSLSDIDVDHYAQQIETRLREWDHDHEPYFEDREDWLAAYRDLRYQPNGDSDSEIHIPYTFSMGKSMHARLYQAFSQKGAFSVESHNEAFLKKESDIKSFLTWVQDQDLNRGEGYEPTLDEGLDGLVKDGSMVQKWSWDRWSHTYTEVEEGVEIVEVDDVEENELGELVEISRYEAEPTIENKEKTVKKAAGRVDNIRIDDYKQPQGSRSPQTAPWVGHRLWFTDDMLVEKYQSGRFDKDATEHAMGYRRNISNYQGDNHHGSQAREAVANIEGINSQFSGSRTMDHDTENHAVWEYYCRGIVAKEIEGEDYREMDAELKDLVFWYHEASNTILGWTYLQRICPDGRRPFNKTDFIPSDERSIGIGVAELLYSINMYMNAMHQLKMDNGMLASLQWGVYRSSSSLNTDVFRVRPGEVLPVEDVNDVKLMNFPYLGNFGENEEQTLKVYGEKLLALNDINLGNFGAKGVAGALRNATGANFVDKQSTIQLHPHLARIARGQRDVLRALFHLYRERLDHAVYFRVTGKDGRPVFGSVDRNTLRGNYDFTFDIDFMGSSDAEKQQQATLMMQTLLNPTFIQMGIVQPENLYNLCENYLRVHGVKRIYQYLSEPQGYVGESMTPEQRFFRIVHGMDTPPVEQTVRMNENHQKAVEYLQGLQAEGNEAMFGMLDTQQKLAAYQALIDAHMQYLQMMQAPNQMANASGTQMPAQGGLPAVEGAPQQQTPGPVGSPVGESNGPVF